MFSGDWIRYTCADESNSFFSLSSQIILKYCVLLVRKYFSISSTELFVEQLSTITIENLTTFFRWQEPESLIIYLGGYHNGIRRTLLKKIYQELPRISYYHFGDIDAGGFSILKDLRNKTGISFKMYRMDIETLKYYEKYGKELTESDRIRLKEMEKDEELQEVVSYMLLHNVKLEQECVGIGDKC